ncbi:DUF4136 domain-containing protein [Mucilaginibacter hurinus]|uniref:DUF4136 domain-containing protein n=1 Tax=Mucilaginibacter hurinus TaxID=2201324 RepID=A0A367GQT9_9SPHI|nr:DUF4136 domain-containing protein [Mucilaginibacter hurinus]RCH55620.1 DUF4136 domain-containing protein [Mucilaginibacter hurinus]
MKRVIYAGLLLFIMTGLTACSNYRYYTAAKNNTNLNGYNTFGWVEAAKPTNDPKKIYANDIADENIRTAGTAALKAKGLNEAAYPDLLVSYTSMTGRGVKTQYYGSPYMGWGGWGWGFRPWGWGGWGWGGGGFAERVPFREGTIIIDLIDRRTGKMVWRGYGVGELRNPQKAIQDLPKVVTGIIEKLEITPGSRS